MKFLIWFGCLFLNAVITVLINYSGILLGGIPTAILFYLTWILARTLCKKYDIYKENKKNQKCKEKIIDESIVPDKNDVCDSQPSMLKEANNAETKTKNKKIKKEKKRRIRYCSRCGSMVDNETKVCSGCGKKYFKGIKITRFSLSIIILTILLITSLILNVVLTVLINGWIDAYEHLAGNYFSSEETYDSNDTDYYESLESLEEAVNRNPDDFKQPVKISVEGRIARTDNDEIYLSYNWSSLRYFYAGKNIALSLVPSENVYLTRVYMKDDKKNRVLTGDEVIIHGVYSYSEKTLSDCTYEFVEY